MTVLKICSLDLSGHAMLTARTERKGAVLLVSVPQDWYGLPNYLKCVASVNAFR